MNKAVTIDPENVYATFELVGVRPIESLNVQLEEYRHRTTGATHYHLNADSAENVFLVALKTIPTDSTGVAHILEHTALCGSEKYPVRDPFFMMLRRSLNTFMNAMTSSDWTAYPFASQNRKDFDNLLSVYLDAVFFSRLDPLDFAQEGHRLEFEEAENPNSPLLYKGVVFNEMKGAMSSVVSTLWHKIGSHLFPTTTYHFNSGGEPEDIPDLTYGELKDFYSRHYHPSNAVFMTFGDIPASQHHQQFESQVLHRFEKRDDCPVVPDEKRLLAPIRVEDYYALEGADDSTGKTHIVMGWLWGKNTCLKDILEGHLLSGVLLEHSASPLRQFLETTELGNAPSPLCGMEDSNRELVFVCGLEGTDPQHTEAVETSVMDVCRQVAEEGVPYSELEAVLHQLELHQREIGGDGYPYGLQLLMQGLGTAIHQGDPADLLDLDPILEELREAIKDENYIRKLAKKLLVDNQHRVTLTLKPDTALAERKEAAEAQRLASIKANLDESAINTIIADTLALQERQQAVDDESVLPRLTLEDVPASLPQPSGNTETIGQVPCTSYITGTNGLVYEQVVITLPELSAEERQLLPHYAHMLSELGIGSEDYLQVQQRQAAACGGIHAYSSLRSQPGNSKDVSGYMVLSAKALNRNFGATHQLVLDTLTAVRFDELPRLRELVAQTLARREQSITGNGHGLAMTAACAGISPLAAHSHQTTGLQGIAALKGLDKELQNEQALAAFGQQLAALHAKLMAAPHQVLLVGESGILSECQQQLAAQPLPAGQAESEFSLPLVNTEQQSIWTTNTQVTFCAQAYPTVSTEHPDAPVLSVLGGFLRNGYLHTAIREQGGAYGGGASHDANSGCFRMFSYRDPRTTETLADFDQSLHWLQDTSHDSSQVEQAILGVVGALDKPASPAGEAKQHFHNLLFNRSDELRQEFRERVLSVSENELKRVAEKYLQPETASRVILTSPNIADGLEDWVKETNAAVHAV